MTPWLAASNIPRPPYLSSFPLSPPLKPALGKRQTLDGRSKAGSAGALPVKGARLRLQIQCLNGRDAHSPFSLFDHVLSKMRHQTMKVPLLIICTALFFSGCARRPIDEGPAAFVIYEPATGDVRTLNEDVKPYVKLYSDFVVISYTRTDDKQIPKKFVHIIPASKLGVFRWLDPHKE